MQSKSRVLEVFRPADRVIVKLQLLEGDLAAGCRLASALGHQMDVLGVAFSPPDSWQKGIRLVSVAVLSGADPEPGVILEGSCSGDSAQEVMMQTPTLPLYGTGSTRLPR
jgi:hypothetical protein